MPYCSNCGARLNDGVKFCSECGVKVLQNEEVRIEDKKNHQRKTVFEGEVHKCPNCGEILNSFISKCPTCGMEIRGNTATSSVIEFFNNLSRINGEKEKIEMIKTYPIPNERESILEFMVMACSNFDEEYYVNHLFENDISDAWLSKVEQCYKKGKYILKDSDDVKKIDNLYNEIKTKITSNIAKKSSKKVGAVIVMILGAILMFSGFGSIVGLCMLIFGIVYFTNCNKTSNSLNKTGFSSWNPVGQFFWILLNFITLGIPAIIYASSKKKSK